MQMSESIKELATALSKAQQKIEGAVKDSENPHFRSKYADLSSVVDACKAHLNKEGISFVQAFEPSEMGTLALTTTLMHISGEWVSGTITMPLPKNDPQGYGSAATYARRYGLAAMVGVCPEDDDGNRATHGNSQAVPAGNYTQQRVPPVEDRETLRKRGAREFHALCQEKQLDTDDRAYLHHIVNYFLDSMPDRFDDDQVVSLAEVTAEEWAFINPRFKSLPHAQLNGLRADYDIQASKQASRGVGEPVGANK